MFLATAAELCSVDVAQEMHGPNELSAELLNLRHVCESRFHGLQSNDNPLSIYCLREIPPDACAVFRETAEVVGACCMLVEHTDSWGRCFSGTKDAVAWKKHTKGFGPRYFLEEVPRKNITLHGIDFLCAILRPLLMMIGARMSRYLCFPLRLSSAQRRLAHELAT